MGTSTLIGAIKLVRVLKDRKRIDSGEVTNADVENEAARDVAVITETGKGAWRHSLTAIGLMLVSGGVAQPDEVDGLVDSVMFFVTNWDQFIGAAMVIVGFGQSTWRKILRR